MKDFIVRIAKEKDLKAISEFGTPVVKELKFYNKEHMARNVYELSVKDLKDTFKNYKDGQFVIAVAKDGNVVGMAVHYFSHGHVDWLDWILVDKEFRRKGVAKAMLGFAIKEARRHHCHKIWCDTHPGNKASYRFFTRMGFRRAGVLKRHAFREDQIMWEKQI